MKTPRLRIPELARIQAFLLAAASLLCLLAPPTHAAPGDLDATFGTGGKVTTPIGSGDDYGRSVAVQNDGKIVVAGVFQDRQQLQGARGGSNYKAQEYRRKRTGHLRKKILFVRQRPKT